MNMACSLQTNACELKTDAVVKSLKRQRCDQQELSSSDEPLQLSKKRLDQDLTQIRLSPHEYLLHLSQSSAKPSLDIDGFFHEYSEEEMEGYDMEVTMAVRSMNMDKLRSLHGEGKTFQCSNTFGESLIHLACRRGNLEMVKFFTEEGKVNIQCRDDFGRTPLHDACWSVTPNFELMDLLISLCPALLLMSDKRGHAPLQYVRRGDWPLWINFLNSRQDIITQIP